MEQRPQIAQPELIKITLQRRRIKHFNKKLHLYTQNGCINQVANRDITQGFGFHIR